LRLYQSQAEEQERPRIAAHLPLDLGTHKFMGGETRLVDNKQEKVTSLLFSGPLQLDALESQNIITFEVEKADTRVRLYAEHEGISLKLNKMSSGHAQAVAGGSGALRTKLAAGSYQVTFTFASAHARQTAEVRPPRTQVTFMISDPIMHAKYNQKWEQSMGECDSGSNFPLALVQERLADTHQLYYNYALIKVASKDFAYASVLQTYNFRVNVTSRLYFEVGMHM